MSKRLQKRRVAIDLFCGGGGVAVGLHKAGFQVIGVDDKPQPRYPFTFIQADALEFDISPAGVDLFWASPPCHFYSCCTLPSRKKGRVYPDLIPAVRAQLKATGKPYIIENVERAPLEQPIMLCGMMFNLDVFRHRLFESNLPLRPIPHWKHNGSVKKGHYFSVVGDGSSKGTKEQWIKAMGIDWMTRKEMTQAIPPAYSEYLGTEVLRLLDDRSAKFQQVSA